MQDQEFTFTEVRALYISSMPDFKDHATVGHQRRSFWGWQNPRHGCPDLRDIHLFWIQEMSIGGLRQGHIRLGLWVA